MTRGLGDEPGQGEGQGEADGHVDEQCPAPRGPGGEHAAEDQTDGTADAGHGGVDAQRAVPARAVGEARGDQGQGARGDQGRAQTLRRAGDEQPGAVGGEAAEQGGQGEQQDARGQGATAAEEVPDASAEQQPAAEGPGVGVEDPGQAGAAEVQAALDVRQRHVDDGGVDADHQVGGDDDEERGAEPRRWRGLGGGG